VSQKCVYLLKYEDRIADDDALRSEQLIPIFRPSGVRVVVHLIPSLASLGLLSCSAAATG